MPASHILWNLYGSTGTVRQTWGGDVLVGTFLATNGGAFQSSELRLTGEFNTGGNIRLVSGNHALPSWIRAVRRHGKSVVGQVSNRTTSKAAFSVSSLFAAPAAFRLKHYGYA